MARRNGPTFGGRVTMSFTQTLNGLVDKDYSQMTASQIAASSPGILSGLSHHDARKLMLALGAETIRDVANNRFVLWAQAITQLAKSEVSDAPNPGLYAILDTEWERKKMSDLAKASPAVSPASETGGQAAGRSLGVRSVQELARDPIIAKAQILARLADFDTVTAFKKAA